MEWEKQEALIRLLLNVTGFLLLLPAFGLPRRVQRRTCAILAALVFGVSVIIHIGALL